MLPSCGGLSVDSEGGRTDGWAWLERYSLQRCVMGRVGWGGEAMRAHKENLYWGF